MINFNTKLIDKDGKIVKQNYKTSTIVNGKLKESNDFRETTLEDVARISLLRDDEEQNPGIILRRYQLFRKINGKGEVELTEEEKTLLISLICSKYDVLFAGQAIELIN